MKKSFINSNVPDTGVIGLTPEGLAWAAVLADCGIPVECTDMDEEVVNGILEGEMPGELSGLAALVQKGIKNKTLTISPNLRSLVRNCKVLFITCMLPADDDDRLNLRFVEAIARQIANQCEEDKTVVIRCNVPPKSTAYIQSIVDDILTERKVLHKITLAVMPEYFVDGDTIAAMQHRGVIAVGLNDSMPDDLQAILSAVPNQKRIRIISWESAELSAFAYGGLTALRQTYLDGLAALCEKSGGDYSDVTEIIRIHEHGIKEEHSGGVGFGGSHLPKEVAALSRLAQDAKAEVPFAKQVIAERDKNVKRCYQRIRKALGCMRGRTVAVLGAGAVSGTDDFRDTPALKVIQMMIEAGAEIRLFVPLGDAQVRWRLYKEREQIVFCDTVKETVKNAQGIVVLGKWQGMNRLLTKRFATLPLQKTMVDISGGFERSKVEMLGFEYYR